jgi:ABC-type transport system involved in multi-copper enzyme maturation permease subunit
MTTTTHAIPDQKAATTRRANPLLSVMAWELRRLGTSRLTWAIPLALIVLSLANFWPARHPHRFDIGLSEYQIAETSAWGMIDLFATRNFLLLVLLLPFVTADGVARDLKRRTHELLMATTLPTWAYVLGRYLTNLLLSLGLAVALLAALLVFDIALPLLDPTHPALPPQAGNILAIWAVVALPATFLLSSVSFAFGTLLPRSTTLVKVGVVIVWLGLAGLFALLPSQAPLTDWQMALDPTSVGRSTMLDTQYHLDFLHRNFSDHTPSAQINQALLAAEQHLPDLWAWLAPELAWAALALALVVLTMFAFQRFRNAFKG